MRNGGRKGNQNNQSYCIFIHKNFTKRVKIINFKDYTSEYVLILKQ